MPGRTACPICPFSNDPNVACIAAEKGWHSFCESTHPRMPAAIYRLTLQHRGEWVEPPTERGARSDEPSTPWPTPKSGIPRTNDPPLIMPCGGCGSR